MGINKQSVSMVRNLAHLEAFYLDKTDQAIEQLNHIIELNNINPLDKADCKLDLADILLFTNDVWEATLLYQQVNLDFRNDAIGQEAKFRNARLSYYIGEFKWAQAQLDVQAVPGDPADIHLVRKKPAGQPQHGLGFVQVVVTQIHDQVFPGLELGPGLFHGGGVAIQFRRVPDRGVAEAAHVILDREEFVMAFLLAGVPDAFQRRAVPFLRLPQKVGFPHRGRDRQQAGFAPGRLGQHA